MDLPDEGESAPKWFTTFFKGFEERLEHRIETVLVKRLDELRTKVNENDEKLTACTMQLNDVVDEVKKLRKEKEELALKLDDLENRSRRKNVIFHGVPESGPREKCQEVVKELLQEFVGLSSEVLNEVERCHRTPTSPSQDQGGNKPRIIHGAFSTFQTKEKVRKACVGKFKECRFKGQKIFVSDDLSKRILQLRRKKMDTLKRLKDEGKKPFFIYPDKLAYRDREGKLHVVA